MIKICVFTLGLIVCANCLAGTIKVLDPVVSFQTVDRQGADVWASGTHGGYTQTTSKCAFQREIKAI